MSKERSLNVVRDLAGLGFDIVGLMFWAMTVRSIAHEGKGRKGQDEGSVRGLGMLINFRGVVIYKLTIGQLGCYILRDSSAGRMLVLIRLG